jgi:hypothetical protein
MKFLLKHRASTLVLVAMLLFAPCIWGQGDIFGVLSGRVTDSTGALITGAKVTIQNEATKLSRIVYTDSNGFYTAPELAVGRYTVKGEKQGFKVLSLTGIDLNAGAHATADLTLEIGTAQEVITVESTGQTINTETAEMSATVDSKQVDALALNERNFVQLTTMIAGSAMTTFDQTTFTTGMSTAAAAINGMREDQNLFTIDGGYNNDSGSNGTSLNNVGIDFIDQVSVQASNFSAEYGRNAAASVNVVTKSGGANFHGGAFEFDRNDFFDATSPTNKLSYSSNPKAVRPPLRYNDYGWDVGGPIIKNKLFFFAGQEWKRLFIANNPAQLTVPTAAELTGNFSDLQTGLKIAVPANYQTFSAACQSWLAGNASSALPTTGYTGNITLKTNDLSSSGCITTDGAAIAKVYSVMSAETSGISTTPAANNATFAVADPQRWREDIIRIDYHPRPSQSIYFRYLHDNLNLIDAFGTFSPYSSSTAGLPTTPTTRIRPGYSYQLGHIWTINTHMINEAKGNASWNKQRIPPQGNTWERSTYGFQFPLPFTVAPAAMTYPNGIPYVTFASSVSGNFQAINGTPGTSGIKDLSGAPTAVPAQFTGPAFALMAPTTDITATDSLTWEKGRHTFKFGGMFARNRKDQDSRPSDGLGQINFQQSANTNTSGIPFADALMGNFQNFTQHSSNPVGFFRFNNISAFVVDNWKVAPKLSFELGVRYEYTVPTYSQQNNLVNFDPSTYTTANAPTSVSATNVFTGGLQDIPPITGVTSGFIIDGLVRPGAVPSNQLARVPGGNSAFVTSVPATAPRGFFQPEHLFAPRLGFAYSLNSKTSIRGGAGLFFDKPEGNIIFGQPGVVPFLYSATFTNGQLANPAGPGGSTPTVFNMSSIDPNLRVSRTAQYSLSIQNETAYGVQLQLAYVGNMGRHLLRQPNINVPSFATGAEACTAIVGTTPSNCTNASYTYSGAAGPLAGQTINQNRPYLGYTDITQFTGDATSDYNGLQFTAEKRRGILTVTFNYTYSKVLSQISGEGDNPDPECAFTCLLQNGTTIPWKQFYTGSTNFDRRQIASATYTLTDPLFKDQHNLQAYALGGWSLSGVTHDQSGQYLTETANVGIGGFAGYSRRANLTTTPSTHAACAAGKICYFDAGAYAVAPTLWAGNAPVGNIVGPKYIATDTSVRKNFGLWRGANFMFQADAFNVFNKANKGNPNTTAGGGSNGQVSSFDPPRQLQFGGKITF